MDKPQQLDEGTRSARSHQVEQLKRHDSPGQRMPLGITSTWRAPLIFLTFCVAPLLILLVLKLPVCNCPPAQPNITLSPLPQTSQVLEKAPELKMSSTEQTYVSPVSPRFNPRSRRAL